MTTKTPLSVAKSYLVITSFLLISNQNQILQTSEQPEDLKGLSGSMKTQN